MAIKINNRFTFIEELITGYKTLQVSGRELISYKITEETVTGLNGSLISNVQFEPREITIKYLLCCDDSYDFRQKYNKLMYYLSNKNLIFKFYDEPDYFYSGVLSDVDVPDGGELTVVSSFTIHCPSPWKVSDLYTININSGQSIDDRYLIYPSIPESIAFNVNTAANFKFVNKTTNQTFGLNSSHSNVVLLPSDGNVTSSNASIVGDITMFSELEQLTIKNGDVIQITNGTATNTMATIKYRRWLL